MKKHCAAGHSLASWEKPDRFIYNALLQMNVTYVSIQTSNNVIHSYIYTTMCILS